MYELSIIVLSILKLSSCPCRDLNSERYMQSRSVASWLRPSVTARVWTTVLVLSFPSARQLSWDVPADAGLLCDKAGILGEGIKETPRFAEADSISSEENVRFMWNLKVRCYIHNFAPPVCPTFGTEICTSTITCPCLTTDAMRRVGQQKYSSTHSNRCEWPPHAPDALPRRAKWVDPKVGLDAVKRRLSAPANNQWLSYIAHRKTHEDFE
jgi:hypothetical protein